MSARVSHVHMYPSDWRSGCIGLTLEEEGLYVRCCAFTWETGRQLPLDDMHAASALMLDVRMYRRIKTRLISKGKLHVTETGIVNRRAEHEHQAAVDALERSARKAPAEMGAARNGDGQEQPNRRVEVGGRKPAGAQVLGDFGRTSGQLPGDIEPNSRRSLPDLCQKIVPNQHPFIELKEKTPLPPLGANHEDAARGGSATPRQAMPTYGYQTPGIEFVNGTFKLSDTEYNSWLASFGGDTTALSLAIVEAETNHNPGSRQAPAATLRRTLARIARDRHDRAQNYAKAAAANRKRGDHSADAPLDRMLEQIAARDQKPVRPVLRPEDRIP